MFRPVDVITIGYLLLLNILVAFFHENLSRPWAFIVLHLCIIAVIVGLVFMARRIRSESVRVFREWYPGLFFVFGFEEINYLVNMVTPERFHQALIAWDYAIFGVHPTIWLGQFALPWLTELLMSCFASFYFLIPLVGLVLYFKNKKEELRELMLTLGIAFYICFLTFIFLPAEGPWITMIHLHPEPLQGGLFTWFVHFVQGLGTVRGGAFPSSHVAVAVVVLIVAYRHQRMLSYFLMPVIIGLFISTVYCRFHYAVDVLSGVLVGMVGFISGHWILQRWGEDA
jgi:membrane-associated phospholipid phosphatase